MLAGLWSFFFFFYLTIFIPVFCKWSNFVRILSTLNLKDSISIRTHSALAWSHLAVDKLSRCFHLEVIRSSKFFIWLRFKSKTGKFLFLKEFCFFMEEKFRDLRTTDLEWFLGVFFFDFEFGKLPSNFMLKRFNDFDLTS